ncbi:hypothetical protein GCM10008901_04310 [Bifidobacterium pullorum]
MPHPVDNPVSFDHIPRGFWTFPPWDGTLDTGRASEWGTPWMTVMTDGCGGGDISSGG